MKHCVRYPDDKFLAVRPCLVAICFGNRPAAKLIGALLYRYNLRVENKEDAENQNAVKAANGEQPDQDTTYRIFRRQSQLVEDMCGEMTEKTLHDIAVPMLQVLGFLDLEEYMQSNCYIVNIDHVQQALNLYNPASKEQPQLEKFLIKGMQLEKFLITSDELEKFLIDKKNFLSGLEKVLIQNRKISNCKRGRKTNGQVPSEGKKRKPQNIKESNKKNKEEEIAYPRKSETAASGTSVPTHAPSPDSHSHLHTGEHDGLHNHRSAGTTHGSSVDSVADASQGAARDPHRVAPPQQQATAGVAPDTRSQLSTCAVEKAAGVSAKVEPAKPRKQGKPTSQEKKAEDPCIPPAPPACPPPDTEWKTTTCLALFTFWRGKPLLSRYQLMKASQCAKALAENYTREQVEAVRDYMAEKDPWWSERPEKVDVCSVAEHIHEKLGEMHRANSKPRKAGSNTVTVPKDSGLVLWHDKAGAQRMMTYAEADENGWEGGFGEFIQHTNYGRTKTV